MAKYYPKSQIITNLYSQDGENTRVNGTLVKAKNSEIYTGFFWTTSNGDYYSGKTPNDPPVEKLTILENASENEKAVSPLNPISQTKSKIALLLNDPEIEIAGFQGISPSGNPNWQWNQTDIIYYMNAKNISTQTPPEYDNPYTDPNLPTEKDYEIGSFKRYFCKQRNSTVYIEISNSMYSNLISYSNKITYFEYKPFRLPWTIIGDKQQVEQINKNIVSLTARKRNLPGFVEYINNDYLKYYKS